MPQGPTVVVDGKKCVFHYFTGKVLSSQKDKETQISSQTYGTQGNQQVAVSSTTVDHHEFFLVDKEGKERGFQLVNFDFPVREGHTVSIVWVIPEGEEEGPYIHVRNHSTDEYHQIHQNRIADTFKKPWWMVYGIAAALILATAWFLSIASMFMILVSFFYFRKRSRDAAKRMLNGPELTKLDNELREIKPFD